MLQSVKSSQLLAKNVSYLVVLAGHSQLCTSVLEKSKSNLEIKSALIKQLSKFVLVIYQYYKSMKFHFYFLFGGKETLKKAFLEHLHVKFKHPEPCQAFLHLTRHLGLWFTWPMQPFTSKTFGKPCKLSVLFFNNCDNFFPFFYQQSDDGCVTYELFYKPEHAKFNQLSQVSFVCMLGYFWGAVIRAWHPGVFGLCCSVRFY